MAVTMNDRLNDVQQIIISANLIEYDKRDTISFIGLSGSSSSRFPNEPKLGIEKTMEQVMDLMGRYNDKLEQDGICLGRAGIKSKNVIDARNLPVLSHNKEVPISAPGFLSCEEATAFADRVGWVSNVPCLKEAVIRMNTFRYLHYEIIDMDVENRACDIRLHDYIYRNGRYLSGAFGTANMKFEADSPAVNANWSDAVLSDGLYKVYSRKDLGWTKEEMELWETHVYDYTAEVQRKLKKEYGTSQFFKLTWLFSSLIFAINYELECNKVSRPKRPSSATHAKATASDEPVTPKKFTRTIGSMSITSENVPKVPTVKTVVKYRTTSWPTRGHFRTLKSGRVIPVKESTHYRHALKDKAENVPMQQVIKFK